MKISQLNEQLQKILESKEDTFLQKLITWVFEHTQEAYSKKFWIETFKLTEQELKDYGISDDLED